MAENVGTGLLLDASVIAEPFRAEIQQSLVGLPRPPKLIGILSSSSAPSKFYAEITRKHCKELGVEFVLRTTGSAFSNDRSEGEGVEEAIIEANEDESVDGILVYYPIFGAQQDHYLQQVVSPLKDVEGLHFQFHYNLYHNIRFIDPKSLLSSTTPLSGPSETPSSPDESTSGMVKSILPCTPLAIVKCLEYLGVYNKILPYGDRAYGRIITVINRSEVVGRPLAALLANDGARVFSVDIDTIQEYTKRPRSQMNHALRYHRRHIVRPCSTTLQECLECSDVVVSAVPSPKYKVPTKWLKDGCVCLNVAAHPNFEEDVRDRVSIFIPAVGRVTITMLLRNLLRLQQYKLASDNLPPPNVGSPTIEKQ